MFYCWEKGEDIEKENEEKLEKRNQIISSFISHSLNLEFVFVNIPLGHFLFPKVFLRKS